MHRSPWEPRPGNRAENHRVPSRRELRDFRRRSDMPYDRRQTWLNTIPGGKHYAAGDLWGPLGAWFSGRWHDAAAEGYIAKVRRALAERTWRRPGF